MCRAISISWKNIRMQRKFLYFNFSWYSQSENTIILDIRRALYKIFTFVRFNLLESRKSKLIRYKTWFFNGRYLFYNILIELNEFYLMTPVLSEYDEFSKGYSLLSLKFRFPESISWKYNRIQRKLLHFEYNW